VALAFIIDQLFDILDILDCLRLDWMLRGSGRVSRCGVTPLLHHSLLRGPRQAIEPFTRGFYTNDLGSDATAEAINANYRGNFNRLVAVNNRYDPHNLFRLNANVEPSV
jgi:hypothetical protein